MNEKLDYIKRYLLIGGIEFDNNINLLEYNDINIIYELYKNGIVNDLYKFDETSNMNELSPIVLTYIGHFFRVKGCLDSMKKYYLAAVNKDYVKAMYYLGMFYQSNDIGQHNEELMIKYYIMGGLKGCDDCKFSLTGYLYRKDMIFDILIKVKEYENKIKELEENNKYLETELKCIPEYGEFYKEALNRFTKLANNP